jgi:hypothetical protein
MTQDEAMQMAQQSLRKHIIPFLPASKLQVNGDSLNILRSLEEAAKKLSSNAHWLSRKYPCEFRRVLSCVESMLRIELQEFDRQGEQE